MAPAGPDPSPMSIGGQASPEIALLLRTLLKGRDRSLAQTPGEALGGPTLGMATAAPSLPPARMQTPRGGQLPPVPHGFGSLTKHKPARHAAPSAHPKVGQF